MLTYYNHVDVLDNPGSATRTARSYSKPRKSPVQAAFLWSGCPKRIVDFPLSTSQVFGQNRFLRTRVQPNCKAVGPTDWLALFLVFCGFTPFTASPNPFVKSCSKGRPREFKKKNKTEAFARPYSTPLSICRFIPQIPPKPGSLGHPGACAWTFHALVRFIPTQ